jgi:hypothetical protein
MQTFPPTTPEQEARALVAACLQAIASGWPAVHFKIGQTVNLNGTQATAEPDLPAMIRQAAEMAVMIAQATEDRMPQPQELETVHSSKES